MVLQAKWYSGGKGRGLQEFRQSFIDDKRIAILHDYPDPTIYFETATTAIIQKVIWISFF